MTTLSGRRPPVKSRGHHPVPFWLVFALALAALTAIVAVSFLVGRYAIDPWEVVRIMASRFIAMEHTWRELDAKVVWEVRWPRTLMAVLVGAALSCSGAVYQGVFRNPLVSPDILGVSAAASFGAALAILLSGAFSPLVPSLAFGMGILGVLLAYALARVKGMTPTIMLVLSGVVVSSIFNAGVSIMKYLADPEDDLPAITFWLMGSLSGMRWENLAFAAPIIVVGLAVLMVITWQLNLLTMGDAEARSLGANAQRTRLIAIICATAMTATAVSQSGAIGWVGLVIPHMARILVGPDHRKLVPIAAVLGAAFLLTIDSLTREAMRTGKISAQDYQQYLYGIMDNPQESNARREAAALKLQQIQQPQSGQVDTMKMQMAVTAPDRVLEQAGLKVLDADPKTGLYPVSDGRGGYRMITHAQMQYQAAILLGIDPKNFQTAANAGEAAIVKAATGDTTLAGIIGAPQTGYYIAPPNTPTPEQQAQTVAINKTIMQATGWMPSVQSPSRWQNPQTGEPVPEADVLAAQQAVKEKLGIQ